MICTELSEGKLIDCESTAIQAIAGKFGVACSQKEKEKEKEKETLTAMLDPSYSYVQP